MVKVSQSKKLLLDHYWELCAKRDAVYEKTKGLQEQLDELVNEGERLRVLAMDKKGDIEAERDGPAWLDLKKEIAGLAAALRFTPKPGTYETE
jgi:hypothetical protein